MRRIRYAVAMSLDGYIAGPEGEIDWIIRDPDIDFREVFGRFDTVLMGRRTFEFVASRYGDGVMPGMKTVVVSRTLEARGFPGAIILGGDFADAVARLRTEPGKDIWLFGGGSLFRSLLDAGLRGAEGPRRGRARKGRELSGGRPSTPDSSACDQGDRFFVLRWSSHSAYWGDLTNPA